MVCVEFYHLFVAFANAFLDAFDKEADAFGVVHSMLVCSFLATIGHPGQDYSVG